RQREEATLIDMKGYIVHRWHHKQGFNWHYAELLPDGNIIAVIKENYRRHIGGILLRLDWDSNVVWKMHIACHHDFDVLENGNIMALCREYINNDAIYPGILKSDCIFEVKPIRKPQHFMLEYIPYVPQILWEWHSDQHALELKEFVDIEFPLKRKPRKNQKRYPPRPTDWAHINTVEVLPDNPSAKKDPRFKKGNILISLLCVNTIAVIDRETGKIVWAWGPGELDCQHIPTMLNNGNILIYDNGSNRKYSRVLELDPLKEKIVWEYKADPPESFFSVNQGSSQRLPNGNTLISETRNGRLFEVTLDGEIVWEYFNPDLTPDRERMDFYRTLRYSPQFVERILKSIEK
ncbi:MAG: aryl-sulfate sulfotransferase, partial [Candidatus Heimdallarchaeota archaeon]|nr:aryl-sulfate sulfotransferase [Candidatus Heimdallarchaeota archaeon]